MSRPTRYVRPAALARLAMRAAPQTMLLFNNSAMCGTERLAGGMGGRLLIN